MSPTAIIYEITQNRDYKELWNTLTREEKEQVLKRLESGTLADIPKVLQEIKTGQYRLF